MPGGPVTAAERHRLRRRQETERSRGLHVDQCKVCGDPVPEPFKHDHHEIPQAAGGEGGPIASLCGGCHDNLHRVAQMLGSKRAGLIEDSVRIMYPDANARERLMKLARLVHEYMALKADGHIDLKIPVKVMIELPPNVKLAAQMIANDHRGATGRKLGLAPWISALVKKEVYRLHPHLRPPDP